MKKEEKIILADGEKRSMEECFEFLLSQESIRRLMENLADL